MHDLRSALLIRMNMTTGKDRTDAHLHLRRTLAIVVSTLFLYLQSLPSNFLLFQSQIDHAERETKTNCSAVNQEIKGPSESRAVHLDHFIDNLRVQLWRSEYRNICNGLLCVFYRTEL
jgi:hypothetical protein